MRKLGVLILVVISVAGCKSLKQLNPSNTINTSLRAKVVQQQIVNNAVAFETLQWRGQATLDRGGKSQKISITTRLKQNEGIWFNGSVIVPLARVFISPDKLQFYEKINRQYATLNYRDLKQLLGVSVDYSMVENILSAKPLQAKALKRAKLSFTNNAYMFSLRKRGIEIQFLYDASFRLVEQRIRSDETTLSVVYDAYKKINGQWIPERLSATLFGEKETTLTLRSKQTQLNTPLKMPFSIPEGYKPIKL